MFKAIKVWVTLRNFVKTAFKIGLIIKKFVNPIIMRKKYNFHNFIKNIVKN